MSDEPDLRAILRAERRAVFFRIGLVGLVLLLVGVASMHQLLLEHLAGWQHGDHDLWGRPRWAPPAISDDPVATGEVDLQRVHAELVPAWFIALAHHPADSPRVQRAHAALSEALEGDPQLALLLDQLHTLVSEDPWEHAERIFSLTDAWNDQLRRTGQPWQLESNVVDLGQGPFFYTKSYRVEAELMVLVEGEPTPLRVLRRVDRTNVRESYLGMVVQGQEQALVMVDRVRELALDELWQLLDPAVDPELSALEAAFAPWVRAEIEAGLSPEQLRVLRETAGARWDLRAAAMAINLRQACGSTLVVRSVPWQGLDIDELSDLEALAQNNAGLPCPAITLDELERMRAATDRIRGTEGLEPALEALVAWAGRPTAVHELRHVADARSHGEGRIPCDGCDELPTGATREASAYLASLVGSEAAYTALFQACGQTGGSHAAAVDWIGAKLGDACRSPGPDLAALAALLERRRFGEREAIGLPEGWPRALPVR